MREHGSSRIKTRSQELIIVKSCKHSSGHIYDSIIINNGQVAFLGGSWDDFEYESSRMKNKVTGTKKVKPC
jgi:hypothetical protein